MTTPATRTTLLFLSAGLLLAFTTAAAANPATPAAVPDTLTTTNLTDAQALSAQTGKLILVKTFSKY